LITQLQPSIVNIGKRLTKSQKIYIRNSGFLHYLLHVQDFEQLQSNPRIGASWEGYAIEEIRRALAGHGQLFYYRRQGGAEVDLLIKTPSGRTLCLEIKYDVKPTPSRGFYQSMEDLKPDAQYIIVPKGDAWHYNDDLKVIGLLEFLEQELSRF
jgi:hypothetical protein